VLLSSQVILDTVFEKEGKRLETVRHEHEEERVLIMKSLWTTKCSCELLGGLVERYVEEPAQRNAADLADQLCAISSLLFLIGAHLESVNKTVGGWEPAA
jgi:hypothetical protein